MLYFALILCYFILLLVVNFQLNGSIVSLYDDDNNDDII